MPVRKAKAVWKGSLTNGSGDISLASGAFKGHYSFKSRFEEEKGTNPEELIAAAHAGCFSMALSLVLGEASFTPERIETEAAVQIVKDDQGIRISSILLKTEAEIPGISLQEFLKLAETAKNNCPVSQALAGVEINLEAKLIN